MGLAGVALGCGAASDGDDRAYAIIYGGRDQVTRRLSVVSTLAAGGTAELEASESVLLPAAHSAMFALDASGVAYALDYGAGVIHEYFIEPGPVLRAGRSVFLQAIPPGRGLGFLVISPAKVYVYGSSPEFLVWNRREMTVTKRVALGVGVADGYDSRTLAGSRLEGGELLVITYSGSGPARVAHDLTVSRIDVATDEVISHEVDDRCTGLRGVSVPNGDLYLATRSEVAVEHWPFSEGSIRPCALRLRAGATSLDPSWQVSFSDWVGSTLWGGLINGARGELLTLVAPEAEAAADPSIAPSEAIWQIWEVDAERGTARVHTPLLTTASPRYLRSDDRLYLLVPDSSGPGDTLFDISDPSSSLPGIRLPPLTTSVLRFR